MQGNSFKYSLFMLLAALIWGLAFVAQRVGMDYLGPFSFNAIRFVIGGLVLLPVIAALDKLDPARRAARAHRRSLWIAGLLCGTLLFGATALQQFGIIYTSVGKAGFITALYILIVPLIGLLMKKPVSLRIWISVAVALFGMYLLCLAGEGGRLQLGDLLVLLCAIVFSFHIIVVDRYSPLVDGVRLSCIQFFVAAFCHGVCALFTETLTWAGLRGGMISILYTGVLSSGVAYTLQIIGQKHLAPTVAALLLSLESVFAVLGGWLILHQSMSGRELLGSALIFAAIILAQIPFPGKHALAEAGGTKEDGGN